MAEKNKTSRRPRVSHTEATNRLIDATIKLAGSQPMSDITVGIIAAEADLRSGSVLVKRYFGFRKDLLQAAASKLTNQIVEMLENPKVALSDNPTVNAFIIGAPTHGLLHKRFSLTTELVVEQFDYLEMQNDSQRIIKAMAQNYQQTGINERTALTIARKSYGLLYMQHVLFQLIGLTKEDENDLIALSMFEFGNAHEIEKQLGWV
jgi:AcrR family transcriptional regulator